MKEKNLRVELDERLDYEERDGQQFMVVRAAYVITTNREYDGIKFERYDGFGQSCFLWRKDADGERLYRIHRPEVRTVSDAVRLWEDGGEIDNVLLDYDNVVVDGKVWAGVDPFERYIPF